MKKLLHDHDAGGAIPMILYTMGLLGSGGLYTLFFIIIAPSLTSLMPDSIFRIFIMGIIYTIPMIILVVGFIALMLEGMKADPSWQRGRVF